MSSIGKIFVVVNLVLALVVLGAAGALLKRTDVAQSQLTDLQAQLAASQDALEQERSGYTERERLLVADKQRLQEDKDDLEVRMQSAERIAKGLEADKQQLLDDVTKINARIDALESSYSSTLARSEELSDKNEQLRSESFDAREAARLAETARREAEDQLAALQRRIDELDDELVAARSEAGQLGKLVEVAKTAGFDATSVVAMPRIEANVAEVDSTYKFVILDKGSRDAVERGFTFDVHRNGAYLGRVKVDNVYNDYCTARIEIEAPNSSMQRFDKASTYLN